MQSRVSYQKIFSYQWTKILICFFLTTTLIYIFTILLFAGEEFKHEFKPQKCTGLQKGYSTVSFGVNVWDCELPINNMGSMQWKYIDNLKKYERYLTLGTYTGGDFSAAGPGQFPLYPLSRFDTLSYAFADFENRQGKVIVEVGTSRSYQHGSGPGCNRDEPHFWHPNNPEDWDWGAGHFTALACTSLQHLLRHRGKMFTVDLASSHIERSKLMSKECSEYLDYHVASSLDFFKEYDLRKNGHIDLLYLDTGDMTPIEVTAKLHLEEAQLVVERQLVAPNGLILIDDVRNLTPKQYGEPRGDTYGKAKYSIDYFLSHGFTLVKSEYQFILRNNADKHVANFHAKRRPKTSLLKIFHLSFHLGCINEIEYVALRLGGIVVDSLLWEGAGDGNEKYNINHNRANKYWNLLKERALDADIVITSDTVALSRIFLQNKFPGKLLIWVCNRFDYAHGIGSNPSAKELDAFAGDHPNLYPDREYYNLIRDATLKPHYAVILYTAFEEYYAKKYRDVDLGQDLIKPTGFLFGNHTSIKVDGRGKIPADINKSVTLFIPPYENDKLSMQKCKELGLQCYRGRYAGSMDLLGFKAVLHFPYSWSGFALFEISSIGLIYFIPSLHFLTKLIKEENFFFQDSFAIDKIELSEWYDPKNSAMFVYFNSWEELPKLVIETDYKKRSFLLKKFIIEHENDMLNRWRVALMRL